MFELNVYFFMKTCCVDHCFGTYESIEDELVLLVMVNIVIVHSSAHSKEQN